MKTWNFVVMCSFLMLAVLSIQNVSAEPSAEPKKAPVMNQVSSARHKDPVTKHLENMAKRYGLSTEQQAEIKLILLEDAAKLKELRADTSLNAAEKKAKMHELRDATDSKIHSILTAEQQIKHDALLKDISERRKSRENKGAPAIPTK